MTRQTASRRVVALRHEPGTLDSVVRTALETCGILSRIGPDSRVALKPNLTYPYYKRGVTTSPRVVEAAVRTLRDVTRHVTIVECDGGYGAWKVEQAFEGHGLYAIGRRFDVDVRSLHVGPRRTFEFEARGRRHRLSMPAWLMDDVDLLLTLPVPKIHCMTGLTLAHKNQWGCIPDDMRLRRHYVFDDAIVALNERLAPAVLGDGTYFLDRNGPLEGEPVPMHLVIAASDVGSFDRYVSELMGWSWRRVRHLRRSQARGLLPAELSAIACNVPPADLRERTFTLRRTPRHWIALGGFKSRFLTWFGYESWFGREVLHRVLYALVGRPPSPNPADADVP